MVLPEPACSPANGPGQLSAPIFADNAAIYGGDDDVDSDIVAICCHNAAIFAADSAFYGGGTDVYGADPSGMVWRQREESCFAQSERHGRVDLAKGGRRVVPRIVAVGSAIYLCACYAMPSTGQAQ
eukprot:63229-Rhodomonas_salina.2